MWSIILAALPWKIIFNLVIAIILKSIDKKEKYNQSKKKFLEFIDEIEKDIPIKIHDRYRSQIKLLKDELRIENEKTIRKLPK